MTYSSTAARRGGSGGGQEPVRSGGAARVEAPVRSAASGRKGGSVASPPRRSSPTSTGGGAGGAGGPGRPVRRKPAAVAGRRAGGTVVSGVAWAAALVGATALGQPAIEVLSVPVAVVAAVSATRSFQARGPVTAGGRVGRRGGTNRRGGTGPGGGRAGSAREGGGRIRGVVPVLVAAGGAAVVPLAALGGPSVALGALLAVSVIVLLPGAGHAGSTVLAGGRPGRLIATAGPAAAAMSLVLARGQGSSNALALLGVVFAYDVGSFIMGNARSATGGPAGTAFGLAGVFVVALLVAALMNPPFSGIRPWVIFLAVGVLATAGVAIGDRIAGGTRLPAFRRIDSLILAGPAWVIAIAVIHHR